VFDCRRAPLMAGALAANGRFGTFECEKQRIDEQDYDKVLDHLAAVLRSSSEPMTTRQLLSAAAQFDKKIWSGERGQTLLKRYEGGLHHLVARGDAILARRGHYASTKAWVKHVVGEKLAVPSRDECMRELFLLFFEHFGPASLASFQKFAGRGLFFFSLKISMFAILRFSHIIVLKRNFG
jgi:hypothetical protein